MPVIIAGEGMPHTERSTAPPLNKCPRELWDRIKGAQHHGVKIGAG